MRQNSLYHPSKEFPLEPLRQVTVPGLELSAKTISVQKDKILKREIDLPLPDCSVLWPFGEIFPKSVLLVSPEEIYSLVSGLLCVGGRVSLNTI